MSGGKGGREEGREKGGGKESVEEGEVGRKRGSAEV
jgi:hypothetical protein